MNDKYRYYKEFEQTKDKDKFVKLLIKKYGLKKHSARRRWYDVYKLKPKKEEKNYSKHIVQKNKVYLYEWEQTGNKEDFIKLLLNKYPILKPQTAERRYYDVKNIPIKIKTVKTNKKVKKKAEIKKEEQTKPQIKIKPKYDDENKQHVSDLKMLMLTDMIRFNIKMTRKYLHKYGFSDYEINWLDDNGHIYLEDEY